MATLKMISQLTNKRKIEAQRGVGLEECVSTCFWLTNGDHKTVIKVTDEGLDAMVKLRDALRGGTPDYAEEANYLLAS